MQDNQLIFLVSQPRAGSTLLQRVLGRHGDIHTTTEPWLMLDAVQACKGQGSAADHAAGGWSVQARETFLNTLSNDRVVDDGLRQFGLQVYGEALNDTGKRLFLDKTPRYYSILPELAQIFPGARFIILMRNPLSVLCSILRTWVQGHWGRLSSYRFDLLRGPADLVQGTRALGAQAARVRYEDLVSDPAQEIERLCEYIGVPDSGALLEGPDEERFAFGDPVSSHAREAAGVDHSERWREDVQDPQVWRLVHDYLNQMDHTVLSAMGYDYATLNAQLASHKPVRVSLWMTHSLTSLLTPGAITEEACRS